MQADIILLQEAQEETDNVSVYKSHDQRLSIVFSDTVAVMYLGRIVE